MGVEFVIELMDLRLFVSIACIVGVNRVVYFAVVLCTILCTVRQLWDNLVMADNTVAKYASDAAIVKLQKGRANLQEERQQERTNLQEGTQQVRAKFEEEMQEERAKLQKDRAKLQKDRAKLQEERAKLQEERAKLQEERKTLREQMEKPRPKIVSIKQDTSDNTQLCEEILKKAGLSSGESANANAMLTVLLKYAVFDKDKSEAQQLADSPTEKLMQIIRTIAEKIESIDKELAHLPAEKKKVLEQERHQLETTQTSYANALSIQHKRNDAKKMSIFVSENEELYSDYFQQLKENRNDCSAGIEKNLLKGMKIESMHLADLKQQIPRLLQSNHTPRARREYVVMYYFATKLPLPDPTKNEYVENAVRKWVLDKVGTQAKPSVPLKPVKASTTTPSETRLRMAKLFNTRANVGGQPPKGGFLAQLHAATAARKAKADKTAK